MVCWLFSVLNLYFVSLNWLDNKLFWRPFFPLNLEVLLTHFLPNPECCIFCCFLSCTFLYYDVNCGEATIVRNLVFFILSVASSYSHLYLQVSHTYSKEVAGNPAISPHLYKFHGILNGIDQDIWDPYNDNFIPVRNNSLFFF